MRRDRAGYWVWRSAKDQDSGCSQTRSIRISGEMMLDRRVGARSRPVACGVARLAREIGRFRSNCGGALHNCTARGSTEVARTLALDASYRSLNMTLKRTLTI